MRAYPLYLVGLLTVLAATASAAEPPTKTEPGEALFRSAFEQQLEPDRRVHVLERVVKEHPKSPFADDALWVLGEAARRQGRTMRVLYYWQFLVARWPAIHLEDYTRSLDFYRTSPVGGIAHLLELEGTLFTPQRGHIVTGTGVESFAYSNAVAFNPAPMLVWEELGDCYARLGKSDLAATAYSRSMAVAPVGGKLSGRFRLRLNEKLEAARAKAERAAQTVAATAVRPKAGPAPGKKPKSPDAAPPKKPDEQAAAPASAPATGTAASD